ncbi:MAG TPA: aminotransferase class V-fold PLP-dependent enzyme [Burkholderiaceae bacterium]|jgi:selenocysteine lyase/cysteine desulfurase
MPPLFDIGAVRREFPVTERFRYFDSAHQAPLASSVRGALDRFLDESQGFGGPKPTWLSRIAGFRDQAAALIGARADEIAFTKNTSEGLNIAAHALDLRAGETVLMMQGDHPNNSCAWLNLERRGVRVRFIAPQPGGADAASFAPHLDDSTRVIALSHVVSPTGQRCDLAGIGALCRERGIHLVVDAVQAIGSMPLDVQAMGVSILATGCHKGLLVPQGLGILYVNRALGDLEPAYLAGVAISGSPHDRPPCSSDIVLRPGAARFEIGNLNLPHLHALGAALALIDGIGIDALSRHLLDLGERLIAHMNRLGVGVVGSPQRERRSHINTLRLPDPEWAAYLAAQRVRVSQNRFGVRVSFAMFNTADEVDELAELIAHRLR